MPTCPPGARLVAGDDKGNTAWATVRSVSRPGPAGLVVLAVDPATFHPGPADA